MAKLKTMTVRVMQDGAEKEMTVAAIGPGGHPLYEIDGREVEQDIGELRTILKSSNDENAARRIENKELKDRLVPFGDLNPDKAREALDMVGKFNDKQLVDLKQIDTMKAQWEESWKANLQQTRDSYEGKIGELTGQIDAEKAKIKNILIKTAFIGSDYLKGTIYDPVREQAFKIYADLFDVVEDNGDLQVVHKTKDGSPLISVAKPGQMASFEEAIEHIIGQSPQKDYILKGSQAGGSGAHGGAGGGAKSTVAQLQEQLRQAQAQRNGPMVRQLTDQIHAAQQGG